MRNILVVFLLVVSLCGCSRGNLGIGSPYLDGNGFFVCQKCGGLSTTIDGSKPPVKIAVHAAICPQHDWQGISRHDYIRRASDWPVETRLLPPAINLTFLTSHGEVGPVIYRSGLAFRVGPVYYGIGMRVFIFAWSGLGLSLIGCIWLWRTAARGAQLQYGADPSHPF